MNVISFASLKGGVGKTSLSINIADAFARRECRTLVVDCDPIAHASRFFGVAKNSTSPIAQLFLTKLSGRETKLESRSDLGHGIIDEALALETKFIHGVRENIDLIPSSADLRHFLWGRGARAFRRFFPLLIDELRGSYDYIVIDTPPDYNVITRNIIASADLVVVPVDPSEMSIHCLEELIESASHIKRPAWAIARTMITKNASSVQRIANDRLQKNLTINTGVASIEEDDEINFGLAGNKGIEDSDEFLALLENRPYCTNGEIIRECNESSDGVMDASDSPIFLLDSVIYRTEQQNRLTFQGRTAFDLKKTQKLASQYNAIARELEHLLAVLNVEDSNELPLTEYVSATINAA